MQPEQIGEGLVQRDTVARSINMQDSTQGGPGSRDFYIPRTDSGPGNKQGETEKHPLEVDNMSELEHVVVSQDDE